MKIKFEKKHFEKFTWSYGDISIKNKNKKTQKIWTMEDGKAVFK